MKFKALVESILRKDKKPYVVDSSSNVMWKRKGGDLKGAPKVTVGFFKCSWSCLQSLEGGPEIVSKGVLKG